jgi:DNA-binding NarL/FixJ family response regulator
MRARQPGPRPVADAPAVRCTEPVLVVGGDDIVGAALLVALRASGLSAYACAPATLCTPATLCSRLAARRRRGVVLVDLVGGSFPIEQISLVELLASRGRRVLVLGDRTDPRPTAAAVAAGAVGEVSRSAPFATLVEALEAAALGRPVMSDGDRRRWLDVDRARRRRSLQEQRVVSHLTPRERAVLQRLARGQKAAAIAAANGVSLETVRSQIRSIRVKLGVSSQLEAVALLRAMGG